MFAKDTNYMCRVNVPITRLYSNADDITPHNKFIEKEEILYTDAEQEHFDGSIRLRIYDPDEYAGLWISKSDCDTIIIENPIPRAVNLDRGNLTEIVVTSDNPIVYKTKDGSARIISTLKRNDICYCDESTSEMVNGYFETRYHIVSTESGEMSYNGYWILCDSKVTNTINQKMIDIPVKAKVNPAIGPFKEDRPRLLLARSSFVETTPQYKRDNIIDVTQVGPDGKPLWEDPVGNRVSITPPLGVPTPKVVPNPKAASNTSYEVDTSQKEKLKVENAGSDKFTSVENEDLDLEKILNGTYEEVMNNVGNILKEMRDEEEANRLDETAKDDYDYYKYNFAYDGTTFMSTPVKRMSYVHGLPFQFTHITDRRIGSQSICGADDDSSDLYGRTFAQEIVANIPIAIFVPGEPSFLSSISKNGIIGNIIGTLTGNKDVKENMKSLFTDAGGTEGGVQNFLSMKDGQFDYFSMKVNLKGYFSLVNGMTRFMAKNLGLENRKINGRRVRCDKIDWGNFNADVDKNSDMDFILNLDSGVSFAYDPQSAISDSMSNSTGDSKLAGLLNQSSSTVREINFVMGAGAGKDFLNNGEDAFATTSGGKDSVFGRMSSLMNNTVSGLNIRFPEIWQDSSSSKDYSIDMKFVAPYATPFCIWRYVLVPFAHVLALAGARSLERINSYSSPPLIRAFSKGYFNVEMGMVTSCTWKKFGEGDMMSDDGLPTQMDISLQFKDLYHSLSISPWKATNLGLFFNNTGLIDLLGTLSGMNMNRASVGERLNMFGFVLGGAIRDIPTNFMRNINDRVRNVAYSFMRI